MSKDAPQGQTRRNKSIVSSSDLVVTEKVKQVREQLRQIREQRPIYKALQAQVNKGRAQKNAYLTEIDSSRRDLERIATIGTYIKRKIEFYNVAASAIQKQIDDTRAACDDPRDYMDPVWLRDTNADLLAEITTSSAIREVKSQEKTKELNRRRRARVEYTRKRHEMENQIRELQSGVTITLQTIQTAKRDRDDLRLFMHEHAERTFQTPGDYDVYLRRHEMVQTMRSLEHRILFVRDLNNTRLKEVCSIYRLWLSAVRKDNTVLYNAVISAWKWTPKNKVASGCRKVKHRMLSQGVPSTQSEVLESQICASDCLMSLCEIQRNNFELAVKVEYSDLITHFLQLMQIIVTSQKVQSNV